MGELIDLTSQVQNLRTLNVPDHRRTWRAGPGTTPDTRERTASEGAPSDARTISRGARGSFGFHGTAASARQGAPTLQEPTSETLLVVQRVRLVHPTVVAATTLEQESVPYTRMKIPVTSTRKSVASSVAPHQFSASVWASRKKTPIAESIVNELLQRRTQNRRCDYPREHQIVPESCYCWPEYQLV